MPERGADGPNILIVEREAALYARTIGAAFPGLSIRQAATVEQARPFCRDADILIALAPPDFQALLKLTPAVKWIQALTTGTDAVTASPDFRPGTIVTSGRGSHAPQMSELAFLHMLSLARDFPRLLDNARARRWDRWPQPLLWGKTAVLVGVGSISEELARRCVAFGMRVLGVSDGRTSIEGFERVFPRRSLGEAAALADFLIVLTPLTPETKGLIGRDVLARIKPGGLLLNLARGPVVDEPALIEALVSGRLAGAGLDVFTVEPLPAESPLWTLPNVLVTPHIGGLSDSYAEQVAPVILHNMRAYLSGDLAGMRNRV